MDPKDYWKALRKSWIVLLALTVVGGIVGFAYASSLGDSYRAESSLFVASSGNNSGSDLLQGSTFTQNVVQSYAELATTSSVLTPVIAELNLDTSPTKLARQIDAQVPLNTVFVNITVTDSSASRAASISNSVARSLRSVATDLAPTSSSGRTPIAISIVAPALVPQNPSGPNRHLIEISAALIGLVVGILFAIGRLLFDTRIRTVDDLEARTSVPVIGATRRGTAGQLALRDAPDSPLAEDLRRISATLRFAGDDGPLRTITLTSASRTSTCSTIALELGLAASERGLRVLVIDADLRAPSLAERASIDGTVGLTDVLGESTTLASATTTWISGVDVLPAGVGHSNPHFALGSAAMADLVREVSEQYDFVIVHSASVLDYADALTLGHLTDATLVTARSRDTNRRQLAAALDSLESAKAPVVGIVLTETKLRRRRGHEHATRPNPASAPVPSIDAGEGVHARRAESSTASPSTSATGTKPKGRGAASSEASGTSSR